MSLAAFFMKQKFLYDEVIFWRFCNFRLKMTVAAVKKGENGKILCLQSFLKNWRLKSLYVPPAVKEFVNLK